MSIEMYERIRGNPKFDTLVARRGKFAWTLTWTVLALFYGFFMLVAFAPKSLGEPVAQGSMLTVGVLIEFSLFVLFWVLTAVYVRRANSEFDALTREIIEDARKGEK